MKVKVIFAFLLILTVSRGYSQQVEVSASPENGCPNTTHSVSVTVTNKSGVSVPSGSAFPYSVNVTIKNDVGTTIGTFSNTYTDGFPNNTSRTYVVTNVAFGDPMVCDVEGTLSAFGNTYPYSTTYPVAYPPTLAITENPTGTLEVQTALDGHQVQFFKDGVLEMTTTNTTFTPTVTGSYTAKAEDTNTGCLSEDASNAISITVATTDVKDGQQINFAVYPNPMASSVTITTKLSSKLHYELSDLNGVVVRTAEFTSAANVNVETLKAGSYILTVKDNDQTVASYKLVK